MNWIRFGLAGAYGVIVFGFFFAYISNYFQTSNVVNDIYLVGFLIMVGIVLSMVGSASGSAD